MAVMTTLERVNGAAVPDGLELHLICDNDALGRGTPRVIEMAPIVSLMEIRVAFGLVGDTGIEPVTSSV
jgi:hypothetical protein